MACAGVVFLLAAHAVLLLSIAAEATLPPRYPRCNAGDRAALLAVKAALNNASYFQSWTSDIACCHWYGVDCGGDDYDYDPTDSDRVLTLAFLRDDNLTGAIPGDAIAGLTALQDLTFFKVPGITGRIPSSLTKISGTLKSLTISRTGVSGRIPSFIGEKLNSLQSLDLSFNSLSGAIPPSIAALVNLSYIDISRNSLTGKIPPAMLSKVDTIQRGPAILRLSHNNLTGRIPAEFAGVRFMEIDLSRNRLTGDASMLFGEEKKDLVAVYLSRNELSFDMSRLQLPDRFGFLDVSHNAVYGGIPAQMANLTNLQMLNVSYNRMCGQIPAGGNMARFDAYCFQHNKCLCGEPLAPCGGH
uniref:Leucine-rich repeat-containing N-terminal plant-type domain-containing protein n=1 Tax=Leersia perrieri TaxID=77586 RepID=A0A0D9WBT0_9ORYZ